MSELRKGIVVPSPDRPPFRPPGRHDPLCVEGEVMLIDGFWRWAWDQGHVHVNENPDDVAAFERQKAGMAKKAEAPPAEPPKPPPDETDDEDEQTDESSSDTKVDKPVESAKKKKDSK